MTQAVKNTLVAIAFATSTLLATVTSAQSNPQSQDRKGHDMSSMQGQNMKGHSAGSMELHKIMSSGSKMPMKMSGNVDKDFATMMTMHHQQAIRMSDVLLKHGKSAELKALATKMKAAQQSEIKQLAPFTK